MPRIGVQTLPGAQQLRPADVAGCGAGAFRPTHFGVAQRATQRLLQRQRRVAAMRAVPLSTTAAHSRTQRLARQVSLLLRRGMPAREPLGITLQIRTDQLEFRRRQTAYFQLASTVRISGRSTFGLLQGRAQSLQHPCIKTTVLRSWLSVHQPHLTFVPPLDQA